MTKDFSSFDEAGRYLGDMPTRAEAAAYERETERALADWGWLKFARERDSRQRHTELVKHVTREFGMETAMAVAAALTIAKRAWTAADTERFGHLAQFEMDELTCWMDPETVVPAVRPAGGAE